MGQTQKLSPIHLADQLERAFHGGAWHGPALMELLAGVDAPLARWRPDPQAHSIAELMGHLAHWMEDTRRQIVGEAQAPLEADVAWPPDPDSEEAWQARCAALEEIHCGLRQAVLPLDEGRLDAARPGSDTTLRGLILGTLQHNAYHAGQIALVRKLAEAAGGRLP